MKRIVLTFGLISGVILATMTAIMVPLCMSGRIDFSKSELIGYSIMVLSYVGIFFGIRRYRDEQGGGTITFGRAVKVGLLVTLITSAVYVVSWEIVYYNFVPDFADKYAAFTIDKMRADGASDTAILAKQREMAQFTELYKNPLFNIGMTFMEVFPVGFIVTLVSAAILRRKAGPGPRVTATAAA